MDSYQKELHDTLIFVQEYLDSFSLFQKEKLKEQMADYLSFRNQVDRFLADHFKDICTRSCYENKLSACCSRDGIIIFFADLVVNHLLSESNELQLLLSAIINSQQGFKCIFLSQAGCIWKVKPIVCQMFLCERAQNAVFKKEPELKTAWNKFRKRKKEYTWPDRPVLFDQLEQLFLKAGYTSSFMHYHSSPGLLRIKKTAEAGGQD